MKSLRPKIRIVKKGRRIRGAAMARGRKLLKDEGYPGRTMVRGLARLFFAKFLAERN